MTRSVRVVIFLLNIGGASVGLADSANDALRERFDYHRLGIRSWPNSLEAAARISASQVAEFLVQARFEVNPNPVKSGGDVYAYRFVELRRGSIYLVAALNSGGIVPEIAAVTCNEKSCTFDPVPSESPIDLSDQLVSIECDGVYQIVAQISLGREGLDPSQFWIYEMSDQGLVDATAKFRTWFDQRILPKLKAQMERLPATAGAQAMRKYQAEAEEAMDDYRQRVLGVKDACMEHALAWAEYPETDLLALSCAESAVADSPKVQKVLDALEHASSEYTRNRAVEVRKERAERSVEREAK